MVVPEVDRFHEPIEVLKEEHFSGGPLFLDEFVAFDDLLALSICVEGLDRNSISRANSYLNINPDVQWQEDRGGTLFMEVFKGVYVDPEAGLTVEPQREGLLKLEEVVLDLSGGLLPAEGLAAIILDPH